VVAIIVRRGCVQVELEQRMINLSLNVWVLRSNSNNDDRGDRTRPRASWARVEVNVSDDNCLKMKNVGDEDILDIHPY